jgi:DNA mismatch repair protein MutS
VITGINAGGKSTVMKALTLSLILGQTFGIAPSRSFAFTPFHKINTFLHITDDSSAGRSLFTAELYRARTLTEEIKALNPGEYSFTLLDEIFTATEYVEGEAGAYGVARRLADFPENITVLATHFQGLTSLEQTTVTANGPYRNMKVVVEVADDGSFVRDKEGKFVYPYTLIPGASDQHIALEILEERNFDRAVVAKARDVLAHPEKYTPTELDT